MKDILKKQLRIEYFKANIKQWESELEKYKENKENYISEIINSNDPRFEDIPQTQRIYFIEEFIENDIKQCEAKIKDIKKEIESLQLGN